MADPEWLAPHLFKQLQDVIAARLRDVEQLEEGARHNHATAIAEHREALDKLSEARDRLTEQENMVSQREAELDAREQAIAQKEVDLEAREQQTNAQHAVQKQHLDMRTHELEKAARDVMMSHESLSRRAKDVDDRIAELNQLQANLKKVSGEVASLQERVNDSRSHAQHVRKLVSKLHNAHLIKPSASWVPFELEDEKAGNLGEPQDNFWGDRIETGAIKPAPRSPGHIPDLVEDSVAPPAPSAPPCIDRTATAAASTPDKGAADDVPPSPKPYPGNTQKTATAIKGKSASAAAQAHAQMDVEGDLPRASVVSQIRQVVQAYENATQSSQEEQPPGGSAEMHAAQPTMEEWADPPAWESEDGCSSPNSFDKDPPESRTRMQSSPSQAAETSGREQSGGCAQPSSCGQPGNTPGSAPKKRGRAKAKKRGRSSLSTAEDIKGDARSPQRTKSRFQPQVDARNVRARRNPQPRAVPYNREAGAGASPDLSARDIRQTTGRGMRSRLQAGGRGRLLQRLRHGSDIKLAGTQGIDAAVEELREVMSGGRGKSNCDLGAAEMAGGDVTSRDDSAAPGYQA